MGYGFYTKYARSNGCSPVHRARTSPLKKYSLLLFTLGFYPNPMAASSPIQVPLQATTSSSRATITGNHHQRWSRHCRPTLLLTRIHTFHLLLKHSIYLWRKPCVTSKGKLINLNPFLVRCISLHHFTKTIPKRCVSTIFQVKMFKWVS